MVADDNCTMHYFGRLIEYVREELAVGRDDGRKNDAINSLVADVLVIGQNMVLLEDLCKTAFRDIIQRPGLTILNVILEKDRITKNHLTKVRRLTQKLRKLRRRFRASGVYVMYFVRKIRSTQLEFRDESVSCIFYLLFQSWCLCYL